MSQPRPDRTPPRPQHTTLAGTVVIGASVGVVVTVAEQLANLYSLESREAVADFLSEPPGSQLGLDLTGALLGWRIALMVVAGLATVAAILGYHALRRSHRARIGLAVVAVPIFFGGLVAGGFLTSVVAGAAVLLWIGPSRDYFAGVQPRDRDRHGPSPSASRSPSPFAGSSLPARPRAVTAAPEPAWHVRPQAGRPRPDTVVWACVLTWAWCAVVLSVMVASVALVATHPDLFLDELRRQDSSLAGRSAGEVQRAAYAGAAVIGTWTLLAAVVAVFAYRRAGWARVVLLVSAAVAGVVCLVAVVTSVLMVLPAGGCLAVVVLLNRPEVREWFAGS